MDIIYIEVVSGFTLHMIQVIQKTACNNEQIRLLVLDGLSRLWVEFSLNIRFINASLLCSLFYSNDDTTTQMFKFIFTGRFKCLTLSVSLNSYKLPTVNMLNRLMHLIHFRNVSIYRDAKAGVQKQNSK